MRTEVTRRRLAPLAALLAPLLCGVVATLAPVGGYAQTESPDPSSELLEAHGERSGVDQTPEEYRARVRKLESVIMCACPRENWSKTLANCPDGCADPQKKEIRAWVEGGDSDDEVVAAMVARYGPRVRANPGFGGSGKWVFILPVLGLLIGIGVSVRVISQWSRAGVEAREERQRLLDDVDSEQIAQIERELEALD